VSLHEAIRRLAEGQVLSFVEARGAFSDLVAGSASEAQKGAFLLGLASRGERPDEVAGAVSAMRERMITVAASARPLLDTCGPGGSGAGTLNISTAAALVCAAAGVAVAKHGNRSVTSRCGSADVLEALGVKIECSREEAEESLSRDGFVFLFAPAFHPAMREVAAVRRDLAVRTIFNLIGPLVNPAGATHQLIGVGRFETARLMAESLGRLGSSRAIVFHSENGLDELTPGSAAIGFEVRGNQVARWRLDSGVLAQRPVEPSEIASVGPRENAETLRRVFGGEPGPARETILLNSSVALWLCERAGTLDESFELARVAIDSGAVSGLLSRLLR
jgi:anthranilate phosphoribosyltransferase